MSTVSHAPGGYRHVFHAGNFADVVKHALLCRLIDYLKQKERPFFVLDTHAGPGRYDLTSVEARRSKEHALGIGRLAACPTWPRLLAPYRDAVAALNDDRPPGAGAGAGGWRYYPGSPLLLAAWLRPEDRLIACELALPLQRRLARTLAGMEEAAGLAFRQAQGERAPGERAPGEQAPGERHGSRRLARVRAVATDGYAAVRAYLPPPERRGLVLIDPPYTELGEEARAFAALGEGLARFPTGIFALWLPVKDGRGLERTLRRGRALGVPGTLWVDLCVLPADNPRRLNGSGLLVVHPPWTYPDEARAVLTFLAQHLGQNGPGRWRVEWLTPPAAP